MGVIGPPFIAHPIMDSLKVRPISESSFPCSLMTVEEKEWDRSFRNPSGHRRPKEAFLLETPKSERDSAKSKISSFVGFMCG